MSAEPLSHNQLMQQTIATTITCRSIIKYNSTLSAEQKVEVLAEIEQTLALLEASQTTIVMPAVQATPVVFTYDDDSDDAIEEATLPNGLESRDLSLPDLYRLYQSYLSAKRIEGLEKRYRATMGMIDQLQELASQQRDVASDDRTSEGLLNRVRSFSTALYCMFREFALLLTNIVEGKSIETDTESMSLAGIHGFAESQSGMVRDIGPLLRIYTTHIHLQERRGILADCARDATALLVFLENMLGQNFARRQEILTQLNAVETLLDELTALLAEYEQAMATIIAV